MKKILIIVTKAEVGGAQMSVLGLARGLAAKGFHVQVGCGSDGFLRDQLEAEGIEFHSFRHLKRSHNPLAMAAFVWEIRRFLAANRFDAVILNSYNTLPAAMGAKLANKTVKTILVFRGLSMLDRGYEAAIWLKFLYRNFFRFFLHYVDDPVFVCQANLDTALASKLVRRGTVIYNGTDPNPAGYLEPDLARKQIEQTISRDLSGKFLIGSIGRLAYPKNYEFLINIFPRILEKLPSARLIIFGGGPLEDNYRQMIADLGLEDQVTLAGSIDGASKFIKAFDLFVLPSKFEGLSITLLEAIHAGAPILASRVGGTPEIVGGQESELYGTDNPDEFLSKLEVFAQNQDVRDRAVANNLQMAEKFTLPETVKKYAELLNKPN